MCCVQSCGSLVHRLGAWQAWEEFSSHGTPGPHASGQTRYIFYLRKPTEPPTAVHEINSCLVHVYSRLKTDRCVGEKRRVSACCLDWTAADTEWRSNDGKCEVHLCVSCKRLRADGFGTRGARVVQTTPTKTGILSTLRSSRITTKPRHLGFFYHLLVIEIKAAAAGFISVIIVLLQCF